MKILILGGTGLISTSITRQLLARGRDDIYLYNRGQRDARLPEGWTQLTGDRKDYERFEQQMRDAGTFDCVIDMIGFVPEDVESAVRAFKGRVGQYIFCSTVDVYTKPAMHYPYREDEPLGGLGDYATNKVACENVLTAAQQRGDLPVTIIRPAYTYGEGGVIIHSFGWSTAYIDRIRKGKPIVVHGDGNSLWVALHIDDEARAFVNAAGNRMAIGKAYHTTGETWMTWNQYHQGVAGALGAPAPQLVHIPSTLLARISPQRAAVCAVNFQFNNIFDNTAAREDLGFRQTIPWEEGVRRTVGWLDSHGRIANSDDDPFDDRVITTWLQYGNQMVTEFANVH